MPMLVVATRGTGGFVESDHVTLLLGVGGRGGSGMWLYGLRFRVIPLICAMFIQVSFFIGNDIGFG